MPDVTLQAIEELNDAAIDALVCLINAAVTFAPYFNQVAAGEDDRDAEARMRRLDGEFASVRARMEGLLTHDMRNRLAAAVKDRPEPMTFGGSTRNTITELVLDELCRTQLFFDTDGKGYGITYRLNGRATEAEHRRAVAAGLLDEWKARPRFNPDEWSARIRVECARAKDVGAPAAVRASGDDLTWEARAAAHLQRDPNLSLRKLGALVGRSPEAIRQSTIIRSMKKMLQGEIPTSMKGEPVADAEAG